ncbi:MAG: MFS transporter, partial [Candidatus Gastranaerophilales bacterium]|nr:MFS transporter [Candidatus Gastranaerophilales bacterium]
ILMVMRRIPVAEISLVILGSLLYFGANIQRVAVPGAMFDVLQHDLNTTAQCITSLGASFMYIYALSQLVVGLLIARFGGFRVITAGSVLFLIGSILFPFSKSLPLLYFSRVLIGFGSATFYIGLINETRRLVPKKNFGIVLSLILLIGYLGGIIANAPLVICIRNMGWRETFIITGIATAVICGLFITIDKTIQHTPVDKSVHMDLELFKETFKNKKNLNLYSFACLNYGLYYVVQTVIGKKFLEDFCLMPTMTAATVLSIMGALYAVSGSILAFMSKAALNRRTIFLRISSLNTLFVFLAILVCLFLNIRTPVIGFLFCTIAFGASLSPLLVPLLHDLNGPKVSNTAVSVMTCGFYLAVGILGNITGYFLDLFTPAINSTGHLVYSINSYIAIFIVASILALYSFINVFKIEESAKTKRLITHIEYVKHKDEASDEECEHWHDKYEHDLYTNV